MTLEKSLSVFQLMNKESVRTACLLFLAVVLLTISAKIQIPFYPIPTTLQSVFVVALAYLFGVKAGFMGVMCYLFLGFIGLPVFAYSLPTGPLYFLGPTGGYLAGFGLAAYVVSMLSYIAPAKTSLKKAIALFCLMTIAHGIIFLAGLTWLAYGFPSLGWTKSLQVGFDPFIAVTVSKILAGTFFTTLLSPVKYPSGL